MDFHTGTAVDAVWHFLLLVDPNEREAVRGKQRAMLARYMRAPPLDWDSVEVVEIERYAADLTELIERENAARAVDEERA